MKKLLVIGSFFLLLAGCEATNYTVTIKNESSKTVSYTYNGLSDNLDSNKSKTYEVKAYTQQPTNISVPGAFSVKMTSKDDTFIFVDAKPFNLNVNNKLSIPVILKADDYIDDSGSTEITISANGTKTAKIYTSKPRFSSLLLTPSFTAVSIGWTIENDTMNVTIQ